MTNTERAELGDLTPNDTIHNTQEEDLLDSKPVGVSPSKSQKTPSPESPTNKPIYDVETPKAEPTEVEPTTKIRQWPLIPTISIPRINRRCELAARCEYNGITQCESAEPEGPTALSICTPTPDSLDPKIRAGWSLFFTLIFLLTSFKLTRVPGIIRKQRELARRGVYRQANISSYMKFNMVLAAAFTVILLPFEIFDGGLNVFDDFPCYCQINGIIQTIQIVIALAILSLVYFTIFVHFWGWWNHETIETKYDRIRRIWDLLSFGYYRKKLKYLVGLLTRAGASVPEATVVPIYTIAMSINNLFPGVGRSLLSVLW